MSSLNPSIGRKRASSEKLELKVAFAEEAAAKKRNASAAANRATRQRIYQRVPSATIGGFKVFGSPVQPAHRTKLQIAEAVAKLD